MQEIFASDIPRRKRDKPSRLSRSTATGDQAKGKSGVDRFHYLFEAIEADKASDSETGNDGASSSQGAGQVEPPQGPLPGSEQAEAGELSCQAGIWFVTAAAQSGIDPPTAKQHKSRHLAETGFKCKLHCPPVNALGCERCLSLHCLEESPVHTDMKSNWRLHM